MKTYILVIMSLSSDRGCLHISAYIRIQGKRVSHQITNIRTLTLEVNIFVSVSVFHLSYLSLRNIYTPISIKLTTIRQHFSSEQTCYVYVHDKLFHAPSLSATNPGTFNGFCIPLKRWKIYHLMTNKPSLQKFDLHLVVLFKQRYAPDSLQYTLKLSVIKYKSGLCPQVSTCFDLIQFLSGSEKLMDILYSNTDLSSIVRKRVNIIACRLSSCH